MPTPEQIEKVALNINEMCCILAACKTILAAYEGEQQNEEQVVGIKSAIAKLAAGIELASGHDMSNLRSFMLDTAEDRAFLNRFKH